MLKHEKLLHNVQSETRHVQRVFNKLLKFDLIFSRLLVCFTFLESLLHHQLQWEARELIPQKDEVANEG